MTMFENREKALEDFYAHEQELTFLTRCRSARLFGMLIAKELGLPEGEARRYASSLTVSALNHNSLSAIKAKAQKDILRRKLDISGHMLDVMLTRAVKAASSETTAANNKDNGSGTSAVA